MRGSRLLPWLCGAAAGAVACGGDSFGPQPVARITLSVHDTTIGVGDTLRIAASAMNASGQPLPGVQLSWKSSDPPSAPVSATGLVRALAPGDATISASADGTFGTATVHVRGGVATVAVTPNPASVPVSGTLQLSAIVRDAAGDVLASQPVSWATADASVATVSASGLVTGVANGLVAITASAGGTSGTAQVTVGTVPVASVTVTPSPASVLAGGTLQFTATLKDAQGNVLSGRTVTWATSSASIATISPSGLATGVAQGTANITATAGGKNGVAPLTVSTVPVATVTVSPSSASVPVGGSTQLTATPKDAQGNVLAGRQVTWTTSNAGIATVGADGTVTGAGPGTATITATSEGKSGTAQVTVAQVPVATVTVTPATATVVAGATVQLTATLKDAQGNVLTGRPVTWASGNGSVAAVSATGLVSGVSAGSATITATSEGQSGTAQVTVNPVPVASVTISPSPATVLVGGTMQLSATLKDAQGNVLTGRTVTWGTLDPSIASVNSSGLVSGLAQGTARITAASGGKADTAQVTVNPVPVATVTVTPSSAMIAASGGKVQLTATLKDAQGNLLTGRTVTWSSGNAGAATVSSSGLVTGASSLSVVTITATSEGHTGSAQVAVTRAAGTYLNQAYCSANTARQMDVYVPAASVARPLPVAVFIHGGAWQSGDKSQSGWRFDSVRVRLVAGGYIVANLNYRLATTTTNKWPVQINDVKCAVRQLRGDSATWGTNPARFGAWGTSAGAQLADLLGTTTPSDGFEAYDLGWTSVSSRVGAVVDISGVTDLTRPSELDTAAISPGVVFTTWPDTTSSELINASPVNHSGTFGGPFLVFHGEEDSVVALAQANRLVNNLQLAGGSATLQLVSNADHSFNPANGGSISPSQTSIANQIAGFFDQTVKNAAALAPSVAVGQSPGP
jgi:uncharacterized protein YjdB